MIHANYFSHCVFEIFYQNLALLKQLVAVLVKKDLNPSEDEEEKPLENEELRRVYFRLM